MEQGFSARILIGAGRLRISPEEYAAKIAAGLKWCCHGKHWTAVSEFGRNWGNLDGLTPDCLKCRNARQQNYRADNRRRHERADLETNQAPERLIP